MKRPNTEEKELIKHLIAGGSQKTIAESIARDLQVMTAEHLKICMQSLNIGLTQPEEIARGALERAIKEKASAMPGVTDVEFRYDARSVTVGLNLESGESNSFTGRGWWITPSEEDVAAVSADYLDEYRPLQAKYVTLWDGGTEVITDCLVDSATGQVWPETAEDIDHLDLEILEKEMVRLDDGSEFDVEEIDNGYRVADIEALREAACAPYTLATASL